MEFEEGGILEFGGGEINAGGDAIGDGGDGATGCVGGFEAVERIFDDEAIFGREVHAANSFEVEVGGWFNAGGIATADDFLEVRDEPEFLEPAIDPVVGRAGDDGAGDVFFEAEVEGFANAGHGVEFGDLFADPGVSGDADGGPVEGFSGEFFEVGFRGPGIEVGADALDVFREREVVAVFEEDIAHGCVDGPFGVEDDSVEVEEDGGRFHGGKVNVERRTSNVEI